MALVWAALLVTLNMVEGQSPLGQTVDEIMNTCLDGREHKSKPGPESELFGACKPWAKRSCCSSDTSQGMLQDRTWLNFDYHHCQPLSPRCHEQFLQDLCFYQCSPNIGPYLVPDVRKIRNNRYQNVPLCKRTCEYWWDACKSDLTCTDNWTKNFNWTTGTDNNKINKCPTGSTCRTFQDVFGSAHNFCEKIWDNGFKVVPDTEDCFRLWFSPGENPNEPVARRAAAKLLGVSDSAVMDTGSWLVMVSGIILSVFYL